MATPPPRIGEFDLPVALQRSADVLIKTRTARLLRYTKIVDDMVDKNLGWVPYTQLANLTGRPAISLPLHWTADGLPLGVQFVAPLAGEALLIRLGRPTRRGTAVGRSAAPRTSDRTGLRASRKRLRPVIDSNVKVACLT